jgi:hypothetical protein
MTRELRPRLDGRTAVIFGKTVEERRGREAIDHRV